MWYAASAAAPSSGIGVFVASMSLSSIARCNASAPARPSAPSSGEAYFAGVAGEKLDHPDHHRYDR